MRVIYSLKPGFAFRRQILIKRWHIRDERNGGNGPALLPFCIKHGMFSDKTDTLNAIRYLCPICRKIAEKSQILVIKEM